MVSFGLGVVGAHFGLSGVFDFGLIWVGASHWWSDSVLVGSVLVRDGSDRPH